MRRDPLLTRHRAFIEHFGNKPECNPCTWRGSKILGVVISSRSIVPAAIVSRLLTPEFLLRLGLSRQTRVLNLKSRGPVPRMRSEGADRRFEKWGDRAGRQDCPLRRR